MSLITKKAECRVDLSGGTLDLWPLYLYTGGLELVNMGINVFATAKVRTFAKSPKKTRPFLEITSDDLHQTSQYASIEDLAASLKLSTQENPLRWLGRLAHHVLKTSDSKTCYAIQTRSDAPPGSGLGGSSVLGVALFQALLESRGLGKKTTPAQLWGLQQTIRNLEAIEIEHPAGEQDYLPALFGGLNVVHLGIDQKKIERLSNKTAQQLSKHLAILYTGKPHHSGINNWSVFKGFHDGNTRVRKNLLEIAEISKKMAATLRASALEKVPELLNLEWEARRQLSDSVDAPVLQEAWEFAQRLGATARKGCGAGGGGCLLLYVEDLKKKEKLLSAKLPDDQWKWISSSATASKTL